MSVLRVDVRKLTELEYDLRFASYDYVYEEKGIRTQGSVHVSVKQDLIENDSKTVFRVIIDEGEVHSIQVTKPPQVFKAQVYGSQPNHPSFDGSGFVYGLKVNVNKGIHSC